MNCSTISITCKLALLFFMCTLSQMGISQLSYTNAGGAQNMMIGGIRSTIEGIGGLYGNTAGITTIDKWAVDASFERRFGINELNQISLATGFSSKYGSAGLVISHMGYSEYNEQKIGLAYGRKLGQDFSLGGQIDWLSVNVNSQGQISRFTFDLGVLYQLSKSVLLGAHIFNPFNASWSDISDIGTRYRTGILYKPSQKVDIMVEVDKLLYRPVDLKIGVVYHPSKLLDIAVGTNTTLGIFSGGVVVRPFSSTKIYGAYSSHNQLGGSSGMSLSYFK
jgi:hypothetical protein